jgi:hypothetical protein
VDNDLEILEFHERFRARVREELQYSHYEALHHDDNMTTVLSELAQYHPIVPVGPNVMGDLMYDATEVRKFTPLPRFVAQMVLFARSTYPVMQDSEANRLVLSRWLSRQMRDRRVRNCDAARHMPYIMETFFDPDSVGAVHNAVRRLPRWMLTDVGDSIQEGDRLL